MIDPPGPQQTLLSIFWSFCLIMFFTDTKNKGEQNLFITCGIHDCFGSEQTIHTDSNVNRIHIPFYQASQSISLQYGHHLVILSQSVRLY